MSNQCKECQQTIDWNSKAREKLNTRRPLNPDGTIHNCNLGSRPSSSKPIPPDNDYPNPITAVAKTDSKVDLDHIQMLKAIAQAIQEYIAKKEGK